MAEGSSIVEVDPYTERPGKAWERLKVKQHPVKLPNHPPPGPVSEDHLRFVCMSDTHGKVERSSLVVPSGDVLIHAGDFTMKGQIGEIMTFNAYLGSLPHTCKIVIAGNHDVTFDEEVLSGPKALSFGVRQREFQKCLQDLGVTKTRQLLTKCIYLQDKSVQICGINIYGSPWQPVFCDWAFNVQRGRDILQKWNLIPKSTDILVTHGPPVGYGDITSGNNNVGCVELLNTVQQRVQPKFHVFGHIHEGYGKWSDGMTTYINASTCNKKYRPVNPPIVFDCPIPEGHSKDELLQYLHKHSTKS